MPVSGQGAVPASGSIYNELTAATRRAFVPKLIVQLYYASPTWFYMLGNSQKSAGGLSQITIPVQGQSMVQGQFTGYSGGFNSPVITPGVQNAQFPTCYWVVPVPLPFGETVIQSTDTVISLLKARMNDVYAVTVQNCSSLQFSLNTGNTLLPNSFIDAFDSGVNAPTYGGISRTAPGNTFWQSQYISKSALTGGWTRATMASFLAQVTDGAGGEAPTMVVMNPGDWATLNADFVGNETMFVTPGREYSMSTPARTSFPNLNVNGIPIYMDHFCPRGQLFAPNMKYFSFFASEDAFFDFSGFYSLVPLGQIGQQGVMVLGYNMVCSKPVSGAQAYGFGGNAF